MMFFETGTIIFVRKSKLSWEVVDSNEEYTTIKRLDTGDVEVVYTFNLKVYIYAGSIEVR